MRKLIIICLYLILTLSISLPCQGTGLASLGLSPTTSEIKIGQTFNVSIMANPAGETIDTVRVKISFPSDKLEIQKFSFSSTYSFPSGGNSYDNKLGTLSQGAGVPGGVSQNGVFGTITFKAKAEGAAKVTIDSSSLMLAAGVNKYNGQSYSFTYSLIMPPPAPVQEPVPQAQPKQETSQVSKKPVGLESEGIEEVFTIEGGSSNFKWYVLLVLIAVVFGSGGYILGSRGNHLMSRFSFKKRTFNSLKKSISQLIINIIKG